jgi:hypothetical protein
MLPTVAVPENAIYDTLMRLNASQTLREPKTAAALREKKRRILDDFNTVKSRNQPLEPRQTLGQSLYREPLGAFKSNWTQLPLRRNAAIFRGTVGNAWIACTKWSVRILRKNLHITLVARVPIGHCSVYPWEFPERRPVPNVMLCAPLKAGIAIYKAASYCAGAAPAKASLCVDPASRMRTGCNKVYPITDSFARLVLNGVLCSVIGGPFHAPIASAPAHHHAAFAVSSCHRSRPTPIRQCMVVSAVKSAETRTRLAANCEHYRITRPVFCSGAVSPSSQPICPESIFAEAVEQPPRVGELIVDVPIASIRQRMQAVAPHSMVSRRN